jgi:putative membrane protein
MMNGNWIRFRDGIGGFDRFGHVAWFGDYWWIRPILMFIFWAAVITLIVYLVRKSHRKNQMLYRPEDKALSIVKERYAKGEITKEEFDRLSNDLKR